MPIWPELHAECVRAEGYLSTDPGASCVSARRAAEMLVTYLFDVAGLPEPYKADLNALISDAGFLNLAGYAIQTKLHLIRRNGNTAAHANRPVSANDALASVRELHHVVIWAAYRYSASPDAVPTAAAFDTQRAARVAPLSADQARQLVAHFKAQDAARKAELEQRDGLVAALEAELASLREQVFAAQAAKTTEDHHDYDEATTRDLFIDQLLAEAGWDLSDERDREYPVSGMPNATGQGFVDYVLWGADGLPLAVVEAKRTTKSASVGEQQAKLYADALAEEFGRRPVIFFTNGQEHWIWDDAAGYPPRNVQGFYTADELELLIQRRATRKPLSAEAVNQDVAGRPYQVRAIKAIGESFDQKQRHALLVMATGSGKTRTVIALVDQLMKANWVKRVLFLADRKALVKQAAAVFKEQLPTAPTVNLLHEKTPNGRVFVSTYPTMMNLMNETDSTGRFVYGPGFFDLIVIDEAHRSVYAKYGAIFERFDAMLVGLTATPKDEVDHNTYRLFHLEDGVPTDAYSLEDAVADGYLVPPKAVSVGTKFLRQGITYAELSEDEKDQWDALDWGEDGPPDGVGTEELIRFLFNEDTVDKVLEILMTKGHRVDDGERLGKTIIFAKNQAHAEFIARRFDHGWPHLAGEFARVITHAVSYADTLIDSFSVPAKAPHIAISVDMLDTGIDVPEVVNLVFFKAVYAKTKFWQMIGRGTRLRPDLFGPGKDKENFLIFDFCGNLEFFSTDPQGTEGSVQKSLTQRIVELRVGVLSELDRQTLEPDFRAEVARLLHEHVAGMTLDNVIVRPHRRAIERFAQQSVWQTLSSEDLDEALTWPGCPPPWVTQTSMPSASTP